MLSDKPLVCHYVQEVVAEEFDTLVRIVGKLCPSNFYTRREGVTSEDLLQIAIVRLLETLKEAKVEEVPESQRRTFVRRCLIRVSQQRFYTICRLQKRRNELESGIEFDETAPDFWNTYEELDAMSQLTDRERALLYNGDKQYAELHEAFYPDVCYPVFRERHYEEMWHIEQKLEDIL